MTYTRLSRIKNFAPVFIILDTYGNWRDDRTLRLGAGIAYYGVFAIVPILTLMVGFAAYFFSTESITSFINDNLISILGEDVSQKIAEVTQTFKSSSSSVATTSNIVGVIALFISASLIFIALQDALDTIWHYPVRKGWRKLVLRYLTAYAVVMLTSLLLVAGLIVNTISSMAEYLIPGNIAVLETFADAIFSLGSIAIGALVLALIYKLLIYKKISWSILILGSVVTTILIIIGTILLGYYLSNFGVSSISGAVGALLLIMVWVYYEAQIILIGAQLIKALNRNKKMLPKFMHKY